jgi:hypothetical protein
MLALRRFFGTDRVPFVVDSTVTSTARSYARFSDFTDDVVNGRIWGGLHYRFSTEEGKKLFVCATGRGDVGRIAKAHSTDQAKDAKAALCPGSSSPSRRGRRRTASRVRGLLPLGWYPFDREFQTPIRLEIDPSVA